jgi:heme-degrading monooxygenase HmoA
MTQVTDRGGFVYARLSTYELPGDADRDAEEAFREALRQIDECHGLAEGMYLVSCDGGRAITLTLWDSRAEMEASRVKATRLRIEAAHEVDASIVSTEEFEVAFALTRDFAVR